MLNFNLATLSNEFLVGVAVAAIVISALVASSLFRNVALALAAGAVVLLYLQGGIGALIATSKLVESEIKATPDFSQGLVVGLGDLRGAAGRDAAAGVVAAQCPTHGLASDRRTPLSASGAASSSTDRGSHGSNLRRSR